MFVDCRLPGALDGEDYQVVPQVPFYMKLKPFLLIFGLLQTPPSFGSELTLGQDAYEDGDLPKAQLHFEAAVTELSEAGAHDKAYSEALNKLGNCYYMEGKFGEAESVFKKLVSLDEGLYGKNSIELASDVYSLLRPVRRLHRFLDAEPLIERVLGIRRSVLGEQDELVGNSWLDLAVNSHRLGKLPEAENAYIRAIAIREQFREQQNKVALALRMYAGLLRELNRNEEAEVIERKLQNLDEH